MPPPAAVDRLGSEIVRLTKASQALRSQVLAHESMRDGPGREGQPVEWAAYGLLFTLARLGPLRASALADLAGVDPSTVSRQVAQLVERGLVERQADPHDGRATLLVATSAGQAAYDEMRARRNGALEQLLADWRAEDVDTLATLLGRFNDALQAQRHEFARHMTCTSTARPLAQERA